MRADWECRRCGGEQGAGLLLPVRGFNLERMLAVTTCTRSSATNTHGARARLRLLMHEAGGCRYRGNPEALSAAAGHAGGIRRLNEDEDRGGADTFTALSIISLLSGLSWPRPLR